MVRRAVAALATALLVAACGSSSHSTTTHAAASSSSSSTAAGSANAGSSTAPSPASSSTSAPNASGSTSTTASASSTTSSETRSRARHTHTQPPEATPHFLVKLTIGSGGALTPPGVGIGGHTIVDLSVSNRSGSQAKLELAHGSAPVYTHTLPPGRTMAKLPALKNATYTLLIDGKPRGTLTIGAKAGP